MDDVIQTQKPAERPANKLATTNITNEIVRSLGGVPQFPLADRQNAHGIAGVWLVWDAGPNGEDDYTDHRYWLRWAMLTTTAGDDLTAVAKFREAAVGTLPGNMIREVWVTATNLSERPPNFGGTETPGSHSLSKGTAIAEVQIEAFTADSTAFRFVFQSGSTAKCKCDNYLEIDEEAVDSETVDATESPDGHCVSITEVTRAAWVPSHLIGGPTTAPNHLDTMSLVVFFRSKTYDACGKLEFISGEFRVEVARTADVLLVSDVVCNGDGTITVKRRYVRCWDAGTEF